MKSLFLILLLLPVFVDAQIITTVAGGGTSMTDSIIATNASLGLPSGIAVDAAGNFFIADGNRQVVRKVDAITGIITTVAGTGVAGYNGDGILATAAQLNEPAGVLIDSIGNIYIGDANNYRIRKVDAITGIITTYAGNGIGGYTSDGGLADTTEIGDAMFTLDRYGNMYIGDNGMIRKVDAAGIITTIAGTGILGSSGDGGLADTAELNYELGICTDKAGNVYFRDNNNYTIRKINVSTGIINKFAGTAGIGHPYLGDGLLATASQIDAFGISTDDTENLYIADANNNRIEKVDTFGYIHTIAGTGIAGFSGDNHNADSAQVNLPENVALDQCSNVYVADFSNHRIRKVTFDTSCNLLTLKTTSVLPESGINIYPNPTTTSLTIQSSAQAITQLSITNLLGQTVYNHPPPANCKLLTVDISGLPNGMYFVKINDSEVRKFVKL